MLIAITGGIGCGKSTVLKLFKELGAVTISSDGIVHQLLEREDIKEKVKDILGKDVISSNGDLDKKKMAEIVFSDPIKRRALEKLIHPLVFEYIKEIKNRNEDKIVIAEVPLLFEAKMEGAFNKVITVFSKEELVKRRLLEKGMEICELERRSSCQLPLNKKIEKADYVIDNSSGLSETKGQVTKLWERLKNES